MKTRLFQICLTAAVLLSLLDCSSPVPEMQSLSSGDAGKVITADAGSELMVTLESNATTGYSWTENANMSQSGVLQQTGHQYQPPGQQIPGRGGQEVWTFKALTIGTTTVSMEYKRQFE